MEAEGGDGSRSYSQRQLEVELNAVILAAGHTGRSNIVDRLKDLRGVWLGYAKYEQEREAKEVALLREVERVDRAAAKVAIETERLKRLRDEAMEVVRKVEPGLIDTPPPSRPLSSRSITQDDLLFLNKDLKNVRDLILNDNLREDDLKLTDLVGKSSTFKRRGSYGSLLQSTVMSRDIRNDKTMHSNMPPPMPLMNNLGGYPTHNFAPHHQQYPPQRPHYPAEAYPHYQEAYGQPPQSQYYDAYGNMVPLNVQPTPYTQVRPNYSRDYPPPPPGHQPSIQRSPQPYHNQYGSGPHLNMPHHQNGYAMENSNQRYERDMSTDEGENTSNDAGDISSSEASGSGRRRKNKSMSPKSPVNAKQNDSTESKSNQDQGNSSRKSDYDSPVKKVTQDIKHQPKTSTPKKELLAEKIESPKLDIIRKDNSPRKVEELKQELSPSSPKQSISNVKEGITSDLPKEEIQEKVCVIPTEICNEQNENKKDIKIVSVSNPAAIDQNFTTESGDEDAKLYSSESDTSSQEVLPAKKVSAERERKVGMGPQNTANAYQQMLLGGSKKPPAPVTIDDESTSDDLEAQFAVMAKPKNTFRSAIGSSLHNIDDQSLSDFQPKQNSNLQKQATKPTTKMTGSLGGGMGHPMPLSFAMGSKPAGLSGGKLGHPAAQKMGLLALNTETEDGEEDLSAPENDEEDDFWS